MAMYNRKSCKGVKRGPYRKQSSGFEQYVADVFCERFNELDVTQVQFLEQGGNKITLPTFTRILKGHGSANMNTVAALADMLGLEIIIRPKTTDSTNENKD